MRCRVKKLRQCKCGGDADYDLIESPQADGTVVIYDEVECLSCDRRIIMPEDDVPNAVEVWNVLMHEVGIPDEFD